MFTLAKAVFLLSLFAISAHAAEADVQLLKAGFALTGAKDVSARRTAWGSVSKSLAIIRQCEGNIEDKELLAQVEKAALAENTYESKELYRRMESCRNSTELCFIYE